MKKFVLYALGVPIGCLAALLIIGAIVGPQPKPPAARSAPLPVVAQSSADKKNLFIAEVLKQIGRSSPKWQRIEFDSDNSDKSIGVTIVYRKMPSGYEEVESDTKRVARAVLQTLVSNGRNPHAEWIFVSVRAQKPETGETGVALVRSFGETHYDFNNDQLIFDAAK